jgi:glycosyltransferase involved in cell wall biosynthesis
MNNGFDRSTGELIVYLNADDEFAPGVFDRVVQAYERSNHSKKFMLVMDLMVKEGNGISWVATPSVSISDIADPDIMTYPYNPVSYFYHRQVQEKLGKFPIDLHYAMDYWFLLQAYDHAELTYEPFTAGVFYNENNKTSDRAKSMLEVYTVLSSYYKKKYPLTHFWRGNAVKTKKMIREMKK